MELKTNGDYNPVQLNETINLSPDNKILSRSLMINIRNENPKKVWTLYQNLKKLIDNKEEEPGTKVKDNPEKEKKQINQKKDKNVCPQCGALLVEKRGISKKNGQPYHFAGCSNFKNGCKYTQNILDKEIPADEDLINILR